jgi:hypothetical protein
VDPSPITYIQEDAFRPGPLLKLEQNLAVDFPVRNVHQSIELPLGRQQTFKREFDLLSIVLLKRYLEDVLSAKLVPFPINSLVVATGAWHETGSFGPF